MVERAGEAAGFKFKAHPHMLRHACGFALANQGHDTRALQAYLGHRNIQHTVRYTELAPNRFKDFWRWARFNLQRFRVGISYACYLKIDLPRHPVRGAFVCYGRCPSRTRAACRFCG